jgi:hypothetical protein
MKKKRLLTDRSGKLHDEIVEQAAEQMAQDIDAQVMQSVLKECGWAEVVIARRHKPEKAIVEQWVNDNVKNGFWTYGPVWLFKDPKEANWFALRWY